MSVQYRLLALSALIAVSQCTAPATGGYIRTGNTFSSLLNYQETWNYSTVREGAHTFWWLYHASGTRAAGRPLILWLQGGPGASSTGFGNFMEIGPVDTDLTPRQSTWLSKADLVFVDNPVGTGFSYVSGSGTYTRNVQQIADDLVAWAKDFFGKQTHRQQQPFWIFCESYGGKMTAAFGKALSKAIQRGEVSVNFKGVVLGDSWISPMDYVHAWGPFLYTYSLVGKAGRDRLDSVAQRCQSYANAGKWIDATSCWGSIERVIESETDGVSFYNVLKRGGTDPWSMAAPRTSAAMALDTEPPSAQKAHATRHARSLASFMNGPVKEKLKIIPDSVVWGGHSGEVFSAQYEDFMKPVIDIVDDLLSNSTLHVAVYNGQLDLICATIGTEAWLDKLKWAGMQQYYSAPRTPVHDAHGQTSYFKREHDRLHMYWVMRAGHMAPHDNAEAMDKIVDELLAKGA